MHVNRLAGAVELPPSDKFGNAVFLVAPHHYVHPVYGGHFVAFKLCITACYDYQCARITLGKLAYGLSALLVGKLGYAASVHYAYVGIFARHGTAYATVGKYPLHGCALREIKFATKRVELYRVKA